MAEERTCSKCRRKPVRSPKQRWCKDCHAAYARINRLRYADFSPEQKRKNHCRSYTKILINRGKLKVYGVCSVPGCGSKENVERHHPDYDNPWRFTELCRDCHRALHRPEVELKAKKALAQARPALIHVVDPPICA